MHACYAAETCGELEPFCSRVTQAIFVEGRVLSEEMLIDFAEELGVSAFVLRDQMFWGNDRIPLLVWELNKQSGG